MGQERDCPRQKMTTRKGGSVTLKSSDSIPDAKRPVEDSKSSEELKRVKK